MTEQTLNKLKPKQRGTILKINRDGATSKRIAEMGVLPGTVVEVIRVAPLGDPIDIKVRGYHLSLRKAEAANIIVDVAT